MQSSSQWNLISNHASVLILLSRDGNQPLRQVSYTIGITERAVQRMVADLEEAGYLTRERKGRQNTYNIHREALISHPLLRGISLGAFLDLCNEGSDVEDSETDRILGSWTVGEHGSEVK
ncbi:MAG: helix-turn-helix transcriptional regulator [Opitutaceae bacterium]